MNKYLKHDQLIAQYVEANISRSALLDACRPKEANQQYDRIQQIFQSIVENGYRQYLIPLMDHDEPAVRSSAAFHCLAILPEKAESTLSEIAKLEGTIGFSAEMTLSEWRAGRLKVP